jgi:Trk K+ transport system NAD-binding subunit
VSEVAHDREFPRDCLLVGLRRVDEQGIHIPRGDSEIRSGDEVLSIATGGSIEQLLRVLTRSS